MKNLLFILLSGMVSIFLFTECHRCHGTQQPSLSFSQEDLNINPYSGKEELIYKDSINDSIVFFGTGRATEQAFNYSSDPDGDELMLYHCFGDTYYCDWNHTYFKTTSNGYIELDLNFSNYFRTGTIEKYLTFTINNGNPLIFYCYDSFCFNNDSIFKRSQSTNDSVSAYYVSLHIGNKTFYNVYKLSCQYGNYLYYSIKDGLVGFISKNKTLFVLQKVSKLSI